MLKIKQSRINDFRYSFLLTLLVIQFASCAQKNDYTAKVIYDPPRHIIPSRVTDKWKQQVGDSIIFFFEGGFLSDKLEISHGTKSVSISLNSNQVTQFAQYVAMPAPVDSISTVNFSINGGRTVSVKPGLHRYFAVNYIRNEIVVQTLDDFPYYD